MDEKEIKLIKIASLVLGLTVLFCISIQLIIHFFVTDYFMHMYLDMKIKGLPGLTSLLLGFNTAFLFLFTILAILLVTKEFIIKDKFKSITINTFYLLFSIIHFIFIATALFLPMIDMMKNISD